MDELDRRWSPNRVPDEEAPVLVTGGFDTDGDGCGDTVVVGDGVDLIMSTDLDCDGFADQVLRIGPDGVVRHAPAPPPPDTLADGPGCGIGPFASG